MDITKKAAPEIKLPDETECQRTQETTIKEGKNTDKVKNIK